MRHNSIHGTTDMDTKGGIRSGECEGVEKDGTLIDKGGWIRSSVLSIFAVLAIAFLILPGCATVGAANAKIAADVHELVAPIQQATLEDAKAAVVIAQANHDDAAVQCFTDIVNYLQNDPGASVPAINGVLSGLEAARTFRAPSIPENIHKDCAVIVLDAQQAALRLGLRGATVVGGVKVQAGAAALKAAEAAAHP